MAKTLGASLFDRRSPPSISSRPLVPSDPMSDADSHDVPSLTNFEIRSSRRCRPSRLCLPLALAACLLLVLIAVALAVGLTWRAPGPPARVLTPCGEVVGDIRASVYRFLGLPFARPPLGPLRFKRARDLYVSGSCSGFKQRQDTTRTAPVCLQRRPDGRVVGSEDCLYLNVFSPDIRAGSQRPVVVLVGGLFFFHGGAETPGFKVTPELVKETGAVHVSVNYRLGALGFLPADETNVGLWDVVSALRWVKSFIGRFGGDPDNVLLFGYGSGATSALILSLAASTATYDLFHKVWLASPMLRVTQTRADAMDTYTKKLGCISRECLQNKTSSELASLLKMDRNMYRAWFELPRKKYPTPDPHILLLDDLLLRLSPVNATHFRLRNIPVVLGSTTNEVDVYLRPSGVRLWRPLDLREYLSSTLALSPSSTTSLLALYPFSHGLEAAYTALVTDARLTCPLRCLAGRLRPNTRRLYQYAFSGGGRYVDPYGFEFRINSSFHGWDALLYFSDGSLDRLASARAGGSEIAAREAMRKAVKEMAWKGRVEGWKEGGVNVVEGQRVMTEQGYKKKACEEWRKIAGGDCFRNAWAV